MAWRRFLVDGAAGFIGAALVRRLLDRGGDVTVLVRGGTNPWRLNDIFRRLRVVWGDVTDAHAATEAVAVSRPDVVYHLASHGGSEAQTDGDRILKTNVLGTWTMLAACASSPCRLFVHAGSSSEYGYSDIPMRESNLLIPNSIYAVGKAAATHLCSYLAGTLPFAVVTCRLFSVYGPWEGPGRLVPTILRRCTQNEPLPMVPRTIARDFVYIDDVLSALLRWDRLAGLTGEVINLGSERQTTMEEFVAAALAVTASRSDVQWGAMKRRSWDTDTWVADCEKARTLLQWHARHSLRDGLKKTLNWMHYHAEVEA